MNLKLFKQGSWSNLVFSLEILFLFSVLLSFVLTFILNSSEKPGENKKNLKGLKERYRVFSDILNLKPEKDPENIDISEIKERFILDHLKLKTIETNLSEKNFGIIDDTLNNFESTDIFLTKKKEFIDLKNLYMKKRYKDFSEKYNEKIADPEIKILNIKSHLKQNNNMEALRIFKNVFIKRKVKDIREHLSDGEFNSLVKQIDNSFWLKKINKLIELKKFSEFISLARYIKDRDLINFAYAEIAYSRKSYRRAKTILNRIRSGRFDIGKEKLFLKMRIREDNFENIEKSLKILSTDPDIFRKTLLDIASIFLIKGEIKYSIRYFNQFLKINKNTPANNYQGYWKSLWVTAWLKIKNGEKSEAREFFKTGSGSPVIPYKIAFSYWDTKLNQREKNNMEQYPFTYYYSKYHHKKVLKKKLRLNSFINLINKEGGIGFYRITDNIRSLLKYDLVDDALDYTDHIIRFSNLQNKDMNSIKIIKSLIYLRKGDHYRTFVSFRENFPDYQSLILPNFLKAIYVPIKYKKSVEKFSREFNVDKNLVYALINRESFFRADIISPAKAKGLMQLIDSTARITAKPLNMKLRKGDLYKPVINIKLGVKHFRDLLDKYKGKIYLALAAYNAGSHRVSRWRKEFGNFEEEYFIEMIPFSETRNYVKKILRNYYYYKYYYN